MNTPSVPGKPRRISASLFGAILLCFMLPFVTVSCNDGAYEATLNGYQLVTGTDIEGAPVEPAPQAILALVCAFIGLGVSLLTIKHSPLIATVSGLVGILALLWFIVDVNAYSDSMVTLHTRFGLLLSQLLFVGATGVNGFTLFNQWKAGRVPSVQSEHPPAPPVQVSRSPDRAADMENPSPAGSPPAPPQTSPPVVPPQPATSAPSVSSGQQPAVSWQPLQPPKPAAGPEDQSPPATPPVSGSAAPPAPAPADHTQPAAPGFVWKRLDDDEDT